MERDLNTTPEKTPESKWDFFEDLDDDEEDKKGKDKPRRKWFSAEDVTDIEEKSTKQKAETDDKSSKDAKKEKSKPSVVETEEFAQMNPEQKKNALAKEYVENRSEELQEELENVPEGSPEALQISADLELIQALSDKLEHPEVVADDAVEEAYQQIMDRLDEIFNENEDDEELLPLLEETPDEPESPRKVAPSIFTLPRSSGQKAKPAKSKRSAAPGGPSTSPKTEVKPPPIPESNGPKLKEVVPSSPFLARQRRAGNLAVSEAMNQMLSRRSIEAQPSQEMSSTSVSIESTPQPLSDQPERFVNPVKRSIEEKERRVRQFATKQTLGENISESIFESTSSPTMSEFQPPVPIESMRPVSYQERPSSAVTSERRVTPEQSRDLAQSSTEQLLQIADKIRIDGTTLRSLYASNKIDRSGLTKVIKEALKGGDVKSALSKATLGAEAQRGRKIEMRHDDQTFDDVKGYNQTSEAAKARTDRILESLDMVNQAKNVPNQDNSARTIPNAKDQAMQKAEDASRKARIAVITVLAVAATALIIGLVLAF